MQIGGELDCMYHSGTLHNSVSLGILANTFQLKSTEPSGHIFSLVLHCQVIHADSITTSGDVKPFCQIK